MAKYDSRCKKCWLGYDHDLAQHWESIALYEVWGKVKGQPYVRPDSDIVQRRVKDWVKLNIG